MDTLTTAPGSQYLDGLLRLEDHIRRAHFARRAITDLLLCITLTAGIASVLAERIPTLQQFLYLPVTATIGIFGLVGLLIVMPTCYALDARAARNLEAVYEHIRTAYPDLYDYLTRLTSQPVMSGV